MLLASIEGPALEDYNAERVVHSCWTGGQQERRPKFDGEGANHVTEDELLNFMLNVV